MECDKNNKKMIDEWSNKINYYYLWAIFFILMGIFICLYA